MTQKAGATTTLRESTLGLEQEPQRKEPPKKMRKLTRHKDTERMMRDLGSEVPATPVSGVVNYMKDGGTIQYYEEFLSKEEADSLYELCKPEGTSIEWNNEVIKMFGKTIVAPRKTALLGERDGLTYKYSGVTKVSEQWSELVEALKNRIEEVTGQKYNVALLNYYADGQQYIGWHADDEKDMPLGSKIASFSLGMTRRFDFKHKSVTKMLPLSEREDNENYFSLELKHGSLVVMGGTLQKYWKHALLKLRKGAPSTPRINFTFRLVKEEHLQ